VIAMATTTVSRRIPPQRLLTLMNSLVRGLLASPLHCAVDSVLLTLHLVGRRTGRRYDIPVGYVDRRAPADRHAAPVAGRRPWWPGRRGHATRPRGRHARRARRRSRRGRENAPR